MKKLRIADLFCGAGGTSTGAINAARRAGYKVDVTAINHWQVAVATHSTNHPEARHLCTSIDDVNPRTLYRMGELDVLWASPECTHHSRARGGRPMQDQSRATAWCVTRWAEALLPGLIFVENVPEFLDWGPLGTNGRPLITKRGATFRAWVGVLESLGYRVEWRVLCAADYGAPTTRERLFVQAVRGRRRVTWPARTHAPAAEIERLRCENDLFGLSLQPWRAAREIIDWSMPGRWLDEMPGKPQYNGLPLSPKTLRRIYAGLKRYGLKGCIVPQFGERAGQAPRAHDLDAPLPAVTSHGAGAVVEPYIVPIDHTGNGRIAVNDIDRPLSTVTTEARHALVCPYLVELRGTSQAQVERSGRSLQKPLSTITAGGGHHLLVEPYIVPTAHGGGDSRAASIDRPLRTVCGNRGGEALIEPHLLPQQSDGRLRPVSEPCPTVATAGAIALVQPYLTKFNGTGGANAIDAPLDTVTTKDRFGLVMPTVVLDGQTYRVRLRWRMLQPHELAAGQSFPTGYKFAGTKTDAVKQIGNAVPPQLAEALLGAHLERSAA